MGRDREVYGGIRRYVEACIQPSSVRRVPPSGEGCAARAAPQKRSGARGGTWRVGVGGARGGVRGRCDRWIAEGEARQATA